MIIFSIFPLLPTLTLPVTFFQLWTLPSQRQKRLHFETPSCSLLGRSTFQAALWDLNPRIRIVFSLWSCKQNHLSKCSIFITTDVGFALEILTVNVITKRCHFEDNPTFILFEYFQILLTVLLFGSVKCTRWLFGIQFETQNASFA